MLRLIWKEKDNNRSKEKGVLVIGVLGSEGILSVALEVLINNCHIDLINLFTCNYLR